MGANAVAAMIAARELSLILPSSPVFSLFPLFSFSFLADFARLQEALMQLKGDKYAADDRANRLNNGTQIQLRLSYPASAQSRALQS